MLSILLGAALAGGLPPIPVHDKVGPDLRVGRIIIVGNVHTRDDEILEELSARPGQLLPGEAEFLRAEMRLLMTFHQRFDLADRRRPRIDVERDDFDSNFVDIRVLFPEKRRKKAKP